MKLRPWKIRSSKYVFNDAWLKIRADSCETAEGVIIEPFYIYEPADWVHVVAFDSSDNVLVTRQYRHGSKCVELEIPCGCVEKDENPELAMRRELLEETGCIADQYQAMPVCSPNPARYSSNVFPFIALNTRKVAEQKLDSSEAIEFEFISVDTLLASIDKGEFRHPLHVASVFFALRKRGLNR